jgi:hypothetical protein
MDSTRIQLVSEHEPSILVTELNLILFLAYKFTLRKQGINIRDYRVSNLSIL